MTRSKSPVGSIAWMAEQEQGKAVAPWTNETPVTKSRYLLIHAAPFEDNKIVTRECTRDNLVEAVIKHVGDFAAPAALRFVDTRDGYVRLTDVALVTCVDGNTAKESTEEIEALRAELAAVHSDLGDASNSVFGLLDELKRKEAESFKLRATITALGERIVILKTAFENTKKQSALLP